MKNGRKKTWYETGKYCLMCSTLCRCHCVPEDKAEICLQSHGSQWQTLKEAGEQNKIKKKK